MNLPFTERRYYSDAYTAQFSAQLLAITDLDGRPAAILDLSYFYPTSGGQPHDTGRLTAGDRTAAVIEVAIRESDGQMLHVLDQPLPPGRVEATVDWPRRFDHMQHHTGQHILSQAFIRVAEAETVGFHLSPGTVTIDLDRADLSAAEIEASERMANEVIWQDLPISVRDVSIEEARTLPLRKIPAGLDGRLRLVDIGGFDLTACGGTHVSRTAQVGLLKITKTERRGNQTRVEFCCGGRALADYRQKHDITAQLAAALTTGPADLVASVTRLQDETKALRSQVKRQQAELMLAEAARLLQAAQPAGPAHLVAQVYGDDWELEAVRLVANHLAQNSRMIALLGISGERAQFIFTRSADAPGHMGEAIKAALPLIEGARGGGGPASAQGGGVRADRATMEAALDAAARRLRETIN